MQATTVVRVAPTNPSRLSVDADTETPPVPPLTLPTPPPANDGGRSRLQPLATPRAKGVLSSAIANGPHPVVDPRPQAPARDVGEALQAAEAKLDAWLARSSSPPSVQLAVTYKGQLIYNKALGFKNLENQTPATADSLYQINSMTKSLTAASIMQLVEAGKLSLDTKVVSIVPELARIGGPPERVQNITVRQLLTHTSGLSRDIPFDVWNADHFWETAAWPSWEQMVERFPQERVHDTQHTFKYSNLGVSILGQVVSRVSGMPYDAYVSTHIFAPLGMHDSFFKLDDATAARVATGYSASRVVNGVASRDEAVVLRDPGGLISAAGCRSTAADVARWLSFLSDPTRVPGVLSPASVAQMKANAVFDDSNYTQVGFGLMNLMLNVGNLAFGHTGSGVGYSSAMRQTSDGTFGVVVLTNDFSKQQNRAIDIVMAELPDVAKAPPPVGAPPRDPAWADLIGSYLAASSNKLTSVRTSPTGDLILDGMPLAPVPDKADTFRVVGGDRTADIYEPVFFSRDPKTHAVTAAIINGKTPAASGHYYQRLP